MAPGAAYGTAKRWLPSYFADVMTRLSRDSDVQCVLVGSAGDLETTVMVRDALSADARGVVDLTGRTSLETLAAVLSMAATCVSNDSGAMHLAAAAGAPVAALFGPTREYETAPLPRAGRRVDVLINPVWCRPCMLRECPIDHRCMRGLKPSRVFESVIALMDTTDRRHVPQTVGAASP
jgi:heptosyltransferase-2